MWSIAEMIIVKGESTLPEINLTLNFVVHNKYNMETAL
jgi:hypothetical protein